MTINCNGTLIDLSQPKVMGILNTTPDSFFDGGKYKDASAIVEQVSKMLAEGATFIDVGGYSSRPGAVHISEEEELKRVVPVVELLIANFPEIVISIDTFRSKVAAACISKGAAMINDISAGEMDAKMFETVAELQVPYCMMHMLGTPQNMQTKPVYEHIVSDLLSYFSEKTLQLKLLGLKDILIDVGFGFGKTMAHNYELLQQLSLFKSLEFPLLIGVSRKSMLYKPLGITASEALNATTVAHTLALLNGASILRVHDVKEAVEAVKIVTLYKTSD
ncbi:MAG: dihydropteroate synthase [Flavobacteriaceae bacterium]|nr:MAG: dihydropteroate synthase [Flavobacteriaceae bacterium]